MNREEPARAWRETASSGRRQTQRGTDVLHASRPYWVTLLDKGEIAHSLVGRHRRIKTEHLFDDKRLRDAKRPSALSDLAALDAEPLWPVFANRFTALIDACCLAGTLKRNLLLTLAEADSPYASQKPSWRSTRSAPDPSAAARSATAWPCHIHLQSAARFLAYLASEVGRSRRGVVLVLSVRTIAVVNLKGGSGKTTVAVQLALNWSSSFKTALSDIDPQGSAMLVLDRPPPRLEAVRSSGAKLHALKTMLDRQGFERLVIDTPGSQKADVAAAISAADLALVVVRPSYLDLAAAAATGQLVRQLQTRALVVLNQAPPMKAAAENPLVLRALEALALLSLPVAKTVLRSRVAFGRANELGQSLADLEPASPAAREIAHLLAEVEASLG